MRKLVTRVLAVGVFAVPLTLGTLAVSSAVDASAATPYGVVIGSATPATLPNSNIVTKGTTTKFSPGKLSVTWSAAPPATSCTTALEKATIINKTKKTQTIMLGKEKGTLKPKAGVGLCFWGTGTHTFTVTLKGSTSKLKIAVS